MVTSPTLAFLLLCGVRWDVACGGWVMNIITLRGALDIGATRAVGRLYQAGRLVGTAPARGREHGAGPAGE